MGSFAASEKNPDAWRQWLCWHGGLKPLRFVATGVAPEVLEASTDDVAELSADLDNARLSAADFDRRHRTRLARIWTAEAQSQADFVHAQLGTGTWANDTYAPCPWGNLRRGRTHRFKNPWTPAELEAALNRNGPQRPANAPLGMLGKSARLPRPHMPARPGRLHLPSSLLGGMEGPTRPPLWAPSHLRDAVADRLRPPRALEGPPPDRYRPVPTRVPLGDRCVGLLRELSGLQACHHRGW